MIRHPRPNSPIRRKFSATHAMTMIGCFREIDNGRLRVCRYGDHIDRSTACVARIMLMRAVLMTLIPHRGTGGATP